jgi:hypothetical protein
MVFFPVSSIVMVVDDQMVLLCKLDPLWFIMIA